MGAYAELDTTPRIYAHGFTSSWPPINQQRAGAELNLHIGVVSTDIGAGPYNIVGCSANGDDGQLQNEPRVPGCTGPTDLYIRDVDNGSGRDRNYTGDIADAFACVAQLGVEGCGFEQPLEAMKRALSNPYNNGFLRDDALLAVVLVTDEDDCSVKDTALFDTSQTDVSEPLGALSSFRCARKPTRANPACGPKPVRIHLCRQHGRTAGIDRIAHGRHSES